MNDIDASTWQAVGLTLSLVGLVVSFLLWRQRGPAAGLRGVAWSLLPAAAGLTGTLRLLWQIGHSIVSWAVHLVFSPIVWIGITMAGVSLVLFVLAAAMRARGVGRTERPDTKPVGSQETKQVTRKQPDRRSVPAVGDEDMDDIEAILRKHGIS